MKTLIVEDDFTSRLIMQEMMRDIGIVHVVVDGQEAVEAVRLALAAKEPYQLICLDIVMPGLDGQQALRVIREMENEFGMTSDDRSKILVTTSLDDQENRTRAFQGLCDGYLTKPIHRKTLIAELRAFGFAV